MSKKSISIARTPRSNHSNRQFQINRTKSQFQEMEIDQTITKPIPQWYELKCINNINPLPTYIPTLKKSQPYRLVIDKILNINYPKKSASSLQYVQIMVTLVTTDLQLIGKTCNYQCELPIKSDGKFETPICLYYHSKIDRSYQNVNMIIRFNLNQLKDGYVQTSVLLGIGLIKAPFIQDQFKNAPVYKQCSQIQIVSGIVDKKSTNNMTYSYFIQSALELKNLIKLIPGQTIVSPQDHISGILDEYVPGEKASGIEDGDLAYINLKDCQIHIPDKFQEQVINTVKNMSIVNINASNNKLQTITQRRIVCGCHNQYQMVTPIMRILDYIGKQSTGQYTIQIYEALGDNQIVKIPYFILQKGNENFCALAISLVYVFGDIQYEVAIFAFNPNLQGSIEEISQNMIIGCGQGYLGNLLPIKSNKAPTLILQYISENQIKNEREIGKSPGSRHITSVKSVMNIKQSERIIEQLERERMNLQKQRQQIQFLRTQKQLHSQQQYEKKLHEEKQQLRKNQEKLYQHYREEAEREFNARLELQNQIRVMKQRLVALQQGHKIDSPSHKVSYDQTPYQLDQGPNVQTNNNSIPYQRHKINPNYLLQQERTIPINQVRQLMSKTFEINRQIVEKQLKQFNTASKFTITFNSIIWGSLMNPPKSFYMTIKFFNFKQFTTDAITYIESGYSYHQLIRLNHYTYNLQNITPTYQFIIDPSQYSNPQIIQEDLVNFLSKNNVIVDIFDAENYLYIGQINIKMNALFRGTKSQVMIAKEYNLVRLKGQENYGVIQILLKNQVAQCKDPIQMKEKKPIKQVKKKVISNNPILFSKQMHENEKTQLMGGRNQAKNRQEKRIQMYKKKAAEGRVNKNFDDLENNQKGLLIQKINEYKQKKMPDLIKKIYDDLLTEKITINPYFGQTKTLLYQFTNMSQRPSSFRVSFQGNNDQLFLVKDSTQWKYFVNQFKYPSPKIYDMINDENSFYLSPGETIPLVFKYLSFNKSNHSGKQLITVTVTKQENNWIAGGFSLHIQAHQSVINHSYILYQPGHQTIDIIIPVVFSSNDVRIPKRLFLTIQQAQAEWINQYQIMLKVRTSQIMRKVRFNMLLYEDDYFCNLRENWLVELYTYEGVYAVSKPDQKTKFKISIPDFILSEMKPNRIEFFSSHTGLVFEDEFIEGIRLARGSVQIWCQLFPGSILSGSIQITCISDKKQLLYGWIVQVYPYSAKIG